MKKISDILREMADLLDDNFWSYKDHVCKMLGKVIFDLMSRKPREGEIVDGDEKDPQ